jgi:radical SAM protein with 4Fe4S-binding SPASM domain
MSLKELSFEILRKCPNNCLHCSSMSSNTCKEIVTKDKFEDVISKAATLGLKIVCLSGGEPFLHPDLVSMLTHVKNLGLDCYIYTSGITLDTNGRASSISSDILKIVSSNVTKLIFNIPSCVPQTYDLIMGTKGNLPYLVDTIKNTVAVGIKTEAHFVPMRPNKSDINDTIQFCNKLGISRISFLRLVTHGRAEHNRDILELSNEETDAVKLQLADISKSNPNIRIGVPLSYNVAPECCQAAIGKLNIKYDGNVYPCEVFKNNLHSLNGVIPDNINEKELDEIYNNSAYLRMVRDFVINTVYRDSCDSCLGQKLIAIDGGKNGQ